MYTFIRVFELIVLQKYTNYMGATKYLQYNVKEMIS
nr:MAG TPA: hypothetical protein [Caudoviricetes sp.]